MTSGSFQPRRFGAHLLVAQLGEDCLGTVYRALHGSDEKRFERLRVLQSPELSPPAVFAAIARSADRVAPLSHKAIVQHAELSVTDGAPFVAWYEGTGWTLDFVLSKLRAAGTRLPAAYAMLIAERVCAALEHAWFSPVDGEPIRHGLPWPGFISISNDAEIRLGGFGLAEAILPTLSRGRLARDVAPYAAPEARESGAVGRKSDVYSVGVLFYELLTGRRPAMTASVSPAADELSEGVRRVLEGCFAPPEERTTILELHRAIQEQLAAGSAPVSTADFALFLYTLLNPESQAGPREDGESTNPIGGDLVVDSEPEVEEIREVEVPTRRRTDAAPIPRPAPALLPDGDLRDGFSARLSPAGFEAVLSPIEALSGNLTPAGGRSGRRWIGGLAYFGCAAAIIVGVEALAIHRDRAGRIPAATVTLRGAAPAPVPPANVAPPSPASSAAGAPDSARPLDHGLAAEPRPVSETADALVHATIIERPGLKAPRAAVPPAGARAAGKKRTPAEIAAARNAAEDARFHAGWSRIEAERGEALELARETFGSGRLAESEGQQKLAAGDFDGARDAFERAVAFYRDAASSSRDARLERLRLSSPSS